MSRKTVRTPTQTRQGNLKKNTLTVLVASLVLAVVAGIWTYQKFATGDKSPARVEGQKG